MRTSQPGGRDSAGTRESQSVGRAVLGRRERYLVLCQAPGGPLSMFEE